MSSVSSVGRVSALLGRSKEAMDTKRVGNLNELQCATRLYELGCSVSIPFGNSDKYDLIIDYKDKQYKAQCKKCIPHYLNGRLEYISFKTIWQSHNGNKWKRNQYKSNEIDFFVTYFDSKCYIVWQNECSTEKRLRAATPKNGQATGVSFMKDHVDEAFLASLDIAE